jgi:hypothetical protein
MKTITNSAWLVMTLILVSLTNTALCQDQAALGGNGTQVKETLVPYSGGASVCGPTAQQLEVCNCKACWSTFQSCIGKNYPRETCVNQYQGCVDWNRCMTADY